MDENTCSSTVCSEKFKNIEKEIEQVKLSVNKLESKVDEAEKKVVKIDSELSIKLVQLEAKLDFHTKLVGDKVDNLAKDFKETNEKVEKKMDEFLKSAKTSNDSFKEWIQKLGMKLLEYGVYGGVLYSVAKGLNLF